MFCGECGTENAETRNFCKNCGKALRKSQPAPQTPAAVPSAAQAPAPASVTPVQPAYAPAAQPQPVAMPTPAAVPAPAKPPLNKALLGLGIVGVISGIVSWFLYPYICGILAIVAGVLVLAKSENRKGAVAVVACLAILIGLACILLDLFYFTIFPVPKPVF
jgi:hypothetical protein